MPKCVVFIPDGNRRWARKNLFPSAVSGHSRGRETAARLIEAAFESGAEHVVFLAATDLNLMRRTIPEIAHLRGLLKEELRARLCSGQKGTEVYVRGSWQKHLLDPELDDLVTEVEGATARERGRTLTILFGHNGLDDVLAASEQAAQAGRERTLKGIRPFLQTAHLPEVDLIVRTGLARTPLGDDAHLSGSLLPAHTLKAYLYVTETLWPDFTPEELQRAFENFRTLEKRQGA